jgi:hypothetical protein
MLPYGGENGKFEKINNPGLRRRMIQYSRSGNYDALRDIFAKLGGRGYYSNHVMEDFSPALHHRWQDRRGRVTQTHNVLVPQAAAWKEYLKDLQGKIGRARGGWAASASAFGLRLPGWVTRWEDGGSYRDSSPPGQFTFTMINRAIFIPGYRQTIETVLTQREREMAADLRRQQAGLISHAGLGR